jgi:hypothetical protein
VTGRYQDPATTPDPDTSRSLGETGFELSPHLLHRVLSGA